MLTLTTLDPLDFPGQKVLRWVTSQLILTAFTLPTHHPNNKYTHLQQPQLCCFFFFTCYIKFINKRSVFFNHMCLNDLQAELKDDP